MECLIHIKMGDHGPEVSLGSLATSVEVRFDMSVTVRGNGESSFVRSEVNGLATITDLCGIVWEVPTAKAYLDAADRQGIPVSMVLESIAGRP